MNVTAAGNRFILRDKIFWGSGLHPPIATVLVELGESGQRVAINFNKYGHDGVLIEVRINGGEWTFLAIDTLKPYYDESPLAEGNTHETREYRLRWWDKSVAHGEWSTVLSVLLGV